jgi:hypothetical protein
MRTLTDGEREILAELNADAWDDRQPWLDADPGDQDLDPVDVAPQPEPRPAVREPRPVAPDEEPF